VTESSRPEVSARPTATQIYESGLDHLLASTGDPSTFYAVDETGSRRRLPLNRWLEEAPADEELLLDRAVGPVLDIGCGAGRHLVALRNRSIDASGIEVSELAVEIARRRDVNVIHGSVFDLSEAQGWKTALLLDGNVGIGGEPRRLLSRTAELLAPGGHALVEVEPPGEETRVLDLRLEGLGDVSEWFPWAWVGVDGIDSVAAGTGLDVAEVWAIGERWFAQLSRA
jgi:SAM-dependent methyltransferase